VDPRPHDFIHGHEPGAPADQLAVVSHNLTVTIGHLEAAVLAIKSLENRVAELEARSEHEL
jgi:hypothetical protein